MPPVESQKEANSIHQEVVLKASPERIYKALIDGKSFTEFTGAGPAEISNEAGGVFKCFGDWVMGRHVELVPNRRIVQAWRAKDWDEGVYSIARFELKPRGPETLLVFDHQGFPEDKKEHLQAGWTRMYWEPLKKYLAA